MSEGKHDGKVKILMLGESGVGKSSILQRFVFNKYAPDFVMTLGVEYKQKILEIENKRILVQVWDTAGQERFRTITPIYYRSVQGAILTFDITDKNSFDSLSYWMEDMAKNTDIDKLSIILVGNKCDMENQRKIQKQDAQKLAETYNVKYYETSAKTAANIQEIYLEITKKIIEKGTVIIENKNDAVNITKNTKNNHKKGCCD